MRGTVSPSGKANRRVSTRPPRAKEPRGSKGQSVYDRLRGVAASVHSRELMLTVSPTGLVHEALLRSPEVARKDPEHHEAMIWRQMDRVVIDRARSRNALCRGGSATVDQGTCIEEAPAEGSGEQRSIEDLDLRLALERLASVSPSLREVFRLRYELDLSSQDAAAVLDVPLRTFQRDMMKLRGLLGHILSSGPDQP